MSSLRFMLPLLILPCVALGQEKPKPAAPTLDGLLAQFKEIPGLSASFTEKKHMTLLAKPLVSSGTLHFFSGGKVARHVTRPSTSTVLIDQRSLRMGDADHQETLSLKTNPVLRQFLSSFLKILEGDRKGLEEAYTLTFKPLKPKDVSAPAWELTLAPRRSPMKDAIRSIRFRGTGLVMHDLRIDEVGGDHTITTFSEVDPGKRYTEAEEKQLFAMPRKRGKR